jgi:hypothetical protein
VLERELATRSTAVLRAKALHGAGTITYRIADYPETIRCCEESAALDEPCPDSRMRQPTNRRVILAPVCSRVFARGRRSACPND